MAQFSECVTTIPMDHGFKHHLQQQHQAPPAAPQVIVPADSGSNRGSPAPGSKGKLPKQAGGIDRLLDSVGFYGLDKLNFRNLKNILPSEIRKDDSCEQVHYACNQCTFKGLTSDHVMVHQAMEHTANFGETLQTRLRMMEPNPRNHELKKVFNNISLASLLNGDHIYEPCSVVRVVSRNSVNEGKSETLNEVFLKHGVLGKVQPDTVRCCYCEEPEDELNNIWSHFVAKHPMSPFLAMYSSRGEYQQVKNEKQSLNEIYGIFFATLYGRHQKAPTVEVSKETEIKAPEMIVDDSIEQQREQAEVIVELVPNIPELTEEEKEAETSGKKPENRKRKSDVLEEESEDPKDKEQPEVERVEPAQKRSRFDIVRQVARRSINLLGTAAVAVGVYHLSHYLPAPIQSYLQ